MKIEQFFQKFDGESLTYDDIILLPQYVDFPLESLDLSTRVTKKIRLNIPLVSSPMDTVTEADLAISMALQGGIGIIHYNMSPEEQLAQLQKVKQFKNVFHKNPLLVGAAVETWKEKAEERIFRIEKSVDVIVFDTSQGFTRYELNLIRWTKQTFPHLQVIGGNVVNAEGCAALIEAGADGIRIGMGSGSICTTQEVGGIGRGQATAVYACAKVCHAADVPLLADGGISKSADIVKALSLGANTVMLGSLLAGTSEAPGQIQVRNGVSLKEYRGMGSLQAMEKGSSVRYGTQKSAIRVPEGVSGLIPARGSISEWVPCLLQGVKQGLHKLGHSSISCLHQRFSQNLIDLERRSESARREGQVHSLHSLLEKEMACKT